MNFVKFCENRYQELNLEAQLNREYDCARDAEIKAVHQILTSYRILLKWVLIPKCLLQFVRVQLGYEDEPRAVILEKLKADQEQETSEQISKAQEPLVQEA